MKEGFGSSSSPHSRFRATPHNFVSNQVTTTVIGHPLSTAIIHHMILSSTHRQNQVIDFPLSRPGSIHRLPVIGPCSNFKFCHRHLVGGMGTGRLDRSHLCACYQIELGWDCTGEQQPRVDLDCDRDCTGFFVTSINSSYYLTPNTSLDSRTEDTTLAVVQSSINSDAATLAVHSSRLGSAHAGINRAGEWTVT